MAGDLSRGLAILLLSVAGTLTLAAEPMQTTNAVPTFENTIQETRYQALINELRCPKCQNQNLAGSDAPIAQDLKHQVQAQILAGQSDQQIRDYLIDRYGDFITYKPPMRGAALGLWILPPILLIALLLGWFTFVRYRQRLRTPPLSATEEARVQALLQQTQSTTEENRS